MDQKQTTLLFFYPYRVRTRLRRPVSLPDMLRVRMQAFHQAPPETV